MLTDIRRLSHQWSYPGTGVQMKKDLFHRSLNTFLKQVRFKRFGFYG